MASSQAPLSEGACPPSLVAYNIRYLSLSASQRDKWKQKIDNVQYLLKTNEIVGILETHVDGITAETFFGSHVEGSRKYYELGLAIFVKDDWHRAHRPSFEVIIPSVMVALTWTKQDLRHWMVLFRLDAHSEVVRCDQLKRATQWASGHIGDKDWVSFAGDRNFVQFHYERESSSARAWMPSSRMNTAWRRWQAALGQSEEIVQPEFTWRRVMSPDDGDVGWTFEVLDVAGSNCKGYNSIDLQGLCRRCEDIPFPDASDHSPVCLRWQVRANRGWQTWREGGLIERPIPKWLFTNKHFTEALDSWFGSWFQSRPRGFAAIDEFTRGVHKFAMEFAKTNITHATTPDHKLDTCLAVLRTLQQDTVDERRLSRLLSVYPHLQDIVYLDVSVDEPGINFVSQEVFDNLRAHCRILAQEVVVARAEEGATGNDAECLSGKFRNHKPDTSMIQRLKSLKQGKRPSVEEVWDDQIRSFVNEPTEIADVFLRATRDRQGGRRGDGRAGQSLLDDWAADFSQCRTRLSVNEIELIIRDGPRGKRPGPDGVPGEVYHRHAAHLAVIFSEAWEELLSDEFTDEMYRALAFKTWLVVPKFEGANRTEKFRDLELGDECRKILARILNKVLDEVCAEQLTGLSECQQAFVSKRDIVKNTFAMLRTFWDVAGTAENTESPLLMLLLDCTKGYNLLSREWIVRVLEKARLPGGLVRLVRKLVVNDSILVINGVEQGSIISLAGLTQGCPASCFLYVIAVDPLLEAVKRVPGVIVVSGFVDDWSAGCDGFETLGRAASLINEFEAASGQRINREKSAIVPSRRLTRNEEHMCFDYWGWALQISYRERLLGVYIGLDATIHDQYKDAMDKFEVAMRVFGQVKGTLSIVARLVVVNVFMNTLFSYANRLFFMPRRLLTDVENRVLGFLTPIAWAKVGVFTIIKDLYGIGCELVDLRNSNVAALFSTHERHGSVRAGLHASLSRWRRSCTMLAHPAVNWGAAFGYFLSGIHRTPQDVLHDARRSRRGTSSVNEYRILYKILRSAELLRWREYVANRVRAKGWDPNALMAGLRRLPRSLPQGHRWFLFKLHLNAPMTTARISVAGRGPVEGCAFCGAPNGDRWAHLTSCGLLLSVCDRLLSTADAAGGPGRIQRCRHCRGVCFCLETSCISQKWVRSPIGGWNVSAHREVS